MTDYSYIGLLTRHDFWACPHCPLAPGYRHTIHQQRGGDIQEAAKLAGHKNVRTTHLYNRAGREVARAEVERVQL